MALKLTTAEQAAYGATFATEYRKAISSPPQYITAAGSKTWEEWEIAQATSAAETAWAVVSRMREIRKEMVKGFGDDSDVVEMYDACVNKK